MKLNIVVLGAVLLSLTACQEKLPEIKAKVVTEKTKFDSDDPAIWVNAKNPSESIVFGTDKNTDGGIYAFNLQGKIIKDKSILNIQRPNNVDVAYGFKLSDSVQTDVLVFTEREKQQIRLFAVPDMKPLDQGGFKVFADAHGEARLPMGVALYKNEATQKLYAIVGRKTGPLKNYLYQYELSSDSLGVRSKLVRKFGAFSGKKEIEAIAVDQEMGYVYYSDEQHGIRKYFADPARGDEEIALFGGEYFEEDIEGIAIVAEKGGKGRLIVSNQQNHTFIVFDRQTNAFVKEINLGTIETDGCDAVTADLGKDFPNGLFVSMNDEQNFFFHDLKDLLH